MNSGLLRIHITALVLLLGWCGITTPTAQAQDARELPQSQQFRLGEGMVRIAEPGQIADTVNVWGDISNPGRYMIPRGTTIPEIISYARGPVSLRTGETTLDWSEVRLEVAISRFDPEQGYEEVINFTYHYNEPLPEEFREFTLQSNDVFSVQVRRRPTFQDYIGVIASALSAVATTFVVLDYLTGD